jgi:hypothetical protein
MRERIQRKASHAPGCVVTEQVGEPSVAYLMKDQHGKNRQNG